MGHAGQKRGESWLVVAGIVKGSQASAHGALQSDLVVVSVQGKSVVGMPTPAVMGMMRARPLTMGFLPLEHAPCAPPGGA